MKAIFPGSDTRPTQVGDMDLDLSHDPIWATDRLRSEIFINIMIEYLTTLASPLFLEIF